MKVNVLLILHGEKIQDINILLDEDIEVFLKEKCSMHRDTLSSSEWKNFINYCAEKVRHNKLIRNLIFDIIRNDVEEAVKQYKSRNDLKKTQSTKQSIDHYFFAFNGGTILNNEPINK
ncbi:MAG: hypothetical protein P9X22_07260 [Candidatus Zapsychrus exili]|nr:hypothetical protein [Candidatus Zapsychrus exili]